MVRPDYIVVDVDETDLYDDFARYRHLIVRNERGQNIGVKGFAYRTRMRCRLDGGSRSITTRYPDAGFAIKVWLSLVRMPSLIEEYRSDFTLFSYSQDHGADLEQKYSEAFRFSGGICRSWLGCYWITTVTEAELLFIYHPRLPALETRCCGPRVERSRQLFGAKNVHREQLPFLQRHRGNETARRIGPGEVFLELRYAF